ncbi:MAG: agmatinase family protein [Crocinitomicaceae bacterium]|jgi:agmatinase|nr:agmatinase family protein [Crocinitomicaceae bacterium]
MTAFDPNGIAIPNGNIFGFPVEENDADLVIIPVPWDATASYGKGTADGPEAIRQASLQLDFYHPRLDNAHTTKVFMSPISEEWKAINDEMSVKCLEYIQFLEDGGDISQNEYFGSFVNEMNETQIALKNNLKERIATLHNQGKKVAILGGEHSTPLALIESIDEQGKPFGILQIDAHADLRIAYEDFEQSHASIMYNALKNCENLTRLVQVGIRDVAPSEVQMIQESNGRIHTYFDWDLKNEQYEGKTWREQVQRIIKSLPERVFISFDIDGLKPYLCPNTGTPVLGGFELEEINYLFFSLLDAGKEILGFDLNEVSPGTEGDEWDANVGARALWNLVVLMEKQRRLGRN